MHNKKKKQQPPRDTQLPLPKPSSSSDQPYLRCFDSSNQILGRFWSPKLPAWQKQEEELWKRFTDRPLVCWCCLCLFFLSLLRKETLIWIDRKQNKINQRWTDFEDMCCTSNYVIFLAYWHPKSEHSTLTLISPADMATLMDQTYLERSQRDVKKRHNVCNDLISTMQVLVDPTKRPQKNYHETKPQYQDWETK